LCGPAEALPERDRTISEKDAQIVQSTEALAERDRAISKQDAQILQSTEALADRDRTISEQDAQIAESAESIALIYASTSWRITAPLRFVGRLVRRMRQYRVSCNAIFAFKRVFVFTRSTCGFFVQAELRVYCIGPT
jgi:uncharacterized protein (DUF3084 family)